MSTDTIYLRARTRTDETPPTVTLVYPLLGPPLLHNFLQLALAPLLREHLL